MNLPGQRQLEQFLLKRRPSWLAVYDFYLKPGLRSSWGGPFNGQTARQSIFRDLVSRIQFRAIVETGAFRATTTEFLSIESGLPVHTVESQPHFFYYAKRRLRRRKSIRLELGDSREFLERLAGDPAVPKENVFFYLDSHWDADLPLKREVELIAAHWRNVAIMIDDFEVPGDSGYTFDDYGDGQRLCLDFLQPLSPLGLTAFFPSVPSEQETGFKRGCVVLVDQDIAESVRGLRSLRGAADILASR